MQTTERATQTCSLAVRVPIDWLVTWICNLSPSSTSIVTYDVWRDCQFLGLTSSLVTYGASDRAMPRVLCAGCVYIHMALSVRKKEEREKKERAKKNAGRHASQAVWSIVALFWMEGWWVFTLTTNATSQLFYLWWCYTSRWGMERLLEKLSTSLANQETNNQRVRHS